MSTSAHLREYAPANHACATGLGFRRASILGLGNVLMGDDAFGPLVVETFRCRYECGPDIDVRDLGTPGLDLTPYLYGADLVIFADCVHVEALPGSLRLFREADVCSGNTLLRITGHDPGLQESLLHLRMAGHSPSELLIVGVVPESCELSKPMSSGVRGACAAAAETIACLLNDHGFDCSPRPAPRTTNLWWMEGGLVGRSETQGEAR